MIVRFYANLRRLVGAREAEFSHPDCSTLRQLVEAIISRYPGLRTELFDSDGNLRKHIHIYVNGSDSTFLDGALDTNLALDDTISIFPPIGGGCWNACDCFNR
jgi:MoaD family protein